MAMLEHAINYVKNGFPVIPLCYPDADGNCGCGWRHIDNNIGKAPLTKNGLKDAATTVEQVKNYWTLYPKANIGVVIPEGYFVVDIDVLKGGFESLERLQNTFDELPETLQITTGTGGAHFWYKTPTPIRNTARLAGYDGIDIRGIGGYVVAPPSLHRCGIRYLKSPVWDGEITPAPSFLINLCLKPSIDSQRSLVVSNGVYLEGQRNDRLARDAGAMRRRGLSEQAIYAALQVTNEQRCQPPLSEKEVRTIAKSLVRYPPEPQYKLKGGI